MTLYRHYKSGNLYNFIGFAESANTGERFVVYHRQGEKRMWIRPSTEFFGQVDVDGKQVERFAPVEEAS